MKLLTVGDSFTYGDELMDRETTAWPYLLSQKLSCTVINKGVCGSSNWKMVRSLLEEDLKDINLIIIGWSGFDRIEVADEYGIFDTFPGANKNELRIPSSEVKWRTILIDYVNRHYNDNYLYRQYLSYIILVQSYLKLFNKKYIMLDAWLNHEYPGRVNTDNKDLISQIDTKNFLGWPNESMMEWTAGLKRGPKKHFLNVGHQVVANKIYEHISLDNYPDSCYNSNKTGHPRP